jgi:hypothetical protein
VSSIIRFPNSAGVIDTQKADTDDTAYVTKSTRAINGPYEDAYTTLHISIGQATRSTTRRSTSRPPLTQSTIVRYSAPIISNATKTSFGKDKSTGKDLSNIELTSDDGKTINLDWYSAKHEVLAIYYCFYVEHEAMKPVREWASGRKLDPTERTKYIDRRKSIEDQLNNQVLRLYNFMGLAMNQIDEIRVKYRPNGSSDMFEPRSPLSTRARRAGWQGFIYDLGLVRGGGGKRRAGSTTVQRATEFSRDDNGSRKDKRPDRCPAIWRHQKRDALNEAQ